MLLSSSTTMQVGDLRPVLVFRLNIPIDLNASQSSPELVVQLSILSVIKIAPLHPVSAIGHKISRRSVRRCTFSSTASAMSSANQAGIRHSARE
jgi:hypothetical protein